ncbi:MAG: tetratricopeptide repeat protein [Pseudomonadota bacterium]
MTRSFAKNAFFRAKLGFAVSSAALLAACQTPGADLSADGQEARYRDQISAFAATATDPDSMDTVASAAYWSLEYDKDPSNRENAVNYSAALRKLGSIEQAVKVIAPIAERYPRDGNVGFETGKALVEAGRAFEAIRHLETASVALPENWRVLSALGVALDQIGEHELARTKYQAALTYAPDQISIMNNKGLSFAMSGDLKAAAAILRQAASRPQADARIRQNLALVLAIKGDMKNAERLARSDLPPQIAEGNIEYFRSLVVQPSYWADYAANNADVPDFASDDVSFTDNVSPFPTTDAFGNSVDPQSPKQLIPVEVTPTAVSTNTDETDTSAMPSDPFAPNDITLTATPSASGTSNTATIEPAAPSIEFEVTEKGPEAETPVVLRQPETDDASAEDVNRVSEVPDTDVPSKAVSPSAPASFFREDGELEGATSIPGLPTAPEYIDPELGVMNKTSNDNGSLAPFIKDDI